MKFSILTYITISIVCFLILAGLQFFLVKNTYELKNERYNFEEKTELKESYNRSIINDKLFPGGQKIVDSIIYRNIDSLERLYKNDRKQFDFFRQKVMDSIVHALCEQESIENFLDVYKKENNIDDSFEYALVIGSMDVLFDKKPYANIYTSSEHYALIDQDIQDEKGLRIGGFLKSLNKQNEISSITVSSPTPYTYRMAFALHVEPTDRQITILRQMGLILALSLLSILIMSTLFFVTFRNWIKQKKLSEMKSDFINNVTHELHTPLSAITVANKSLQNEKIIEKKENIRPLTEVIQRQSDRLTMLISQVMDIASMDKLTLNKTECSVHRLLDEILLDYRLNLADTENVSLSFDKGAVRDTVEVDQFYFTSIILNLLDNAIKYNNNNMKTVVVSTSNDRDELQIIISDNGTGMTREIIHNIFDKFYRNTSTLVNTRQSKGLGLGLYYVKRGVYAHKWEITVKSKPGVGSNFTIHIPFQNPG